MGIDYGLSDAQKELQVNAKAFADQTLKPLSMAVDRMEDAWEAFAATREAYRAMAQAGFTKSFIPAEYGGAGFSMLDLAIAAEELSSVDVSVPTTLLGTGLGLQPLLQFGTDEQKRRLLKDFVEDGQGDLLASYAFTDVAGGANYDSPDPAGGMQTVARRDGDEWVISGQKHYTTNGTGWDRSGCHLFSVVCRTDTTSPAEDSVVVIMVPGSTSGIRVVDVYDKVGHRAVVTPRVDFEEVHVPIENTIGGQGQGLRVVSGAFSWTAALIGAACVGTMRAAFEYALEFARREKRLGTGPVIEHQNVGFMLADIKMKIEACRYLTWKACHYFEQTGYRAEELAIMTKVYCSEAAVTAIYDCMRLVGIVSYTRDLAPLEKIMRDAMVFPLYDGGNQGVRRRQLHQMFMRPEYNSMLAARGEVPAWEQLELTGAGM